MKNSKFEKKHGNINIRPEYFHYEFLENIKVVLASGGKIIFKYVLRLSVPSVLREKTLNGEFPLDFFSNINGELPLGFISQPRGDWRFFQKQTQLYFNTHVWFHRENYKIDPTAFCRPDVLLISGRRRCNGDFPLWVFWKSKSSFGIGRQNHF